MASNPDEYWAEGTQVRGTPESLRPLWYNPPPTACLTLSAPADATWPLTRTSIGQSEHKRGLAQVLCTLLFHAWCDPLRRWRSDFS
jgi:hypothetical protein